MSRHYILSAVYLILERDGHVLLLQRSNTGYEDGNYSMVAGHIDEGETPIVAMIREAHEEIGIGLTPEDLDIVHVMYSIADDETYVDYYFKAKKWSGEPKNLEPNKCSEITWFPKQELPENTIDSVKYAYQYYQSGNKYSDFVH